MWDTLLKILKKIVGVTKKMLKKMLATFLKNVDERNADNSLKN
jgi:hypothetical protein